MLDGPGAQDGESYNEREIVIERPDGQRLTALAHANPIHDGSGKPRGGERASGHQRPQARRRGLYEIREAERRRIARDLHDVVLQDLSATLQSLQAAQAELGGAEVNQEVETLRRAVKGLRSAVYDCAPTAGSRSYEPWNPWWS